MTGLLAVTIGCLAVHAETPSPNETPPINILDDFPPASTALASKTEALRDLESGIRAVRTGLPALGIELLLPLSKEEEFLNATQRKQAFLTLLTALIQMDRPATVIQMLRANGDPWDPPTRLRWAMADFLLDNIPQARNRLGGIQPEELSEDDLPWFYLLKGLLADRGNNPARANEAFALATESARTPFLLDTFESIRARLNILRGEVDEQTVISLKNQYDRAVALPMRIQLAREYALVLMGLGRTEEAITFLSDFTETSEADDATIANEILLPLAVFRGLRTPEGRATLWEILRTGTDRENLRIALNLLLRDIAEARPSDADTLGTILEARADHPIRDRLLFARAQLLSGLGDQSTALKLVESLLNDFPGSQIRKPAQLASAFLAWRQDPPQFRTAAARLLEVIPELPATERPFYLQLAGDLYFQNGDYSSAISAYQQAWSAEPAEGIAFQLILSLIESGLIDNAIEWRNANLDTDTDISPEVRWRIDWNLARTLIQESRPEEALTEVQAVLSNEDLPESTRANFAWLEAYTLSLLNRDASALTRIDQLLDSFQSAPETANNGQGPDLESIFAQSLLLQGEILFKNGETEAGTAVMKDLRTRFPNRRAAVLSYLFEARYLAGQDLSAQAQQRLVNLADRFPESDYAPLALFEAAVIAESRGTPESISEAIRFLESIVKRFPSHPLAIHARLKEGEILRSVGDFSSARLLFENTTNRYSNHPLRYLAEIAAAETILANPDASDQDLRDAAATLAKVESVSDIPPSVLLESQLKRAEALRRAGQNENARLDLWQAVEPLLEQRDPANGALAFWLSKSLLELSAWSDRDELPVEGTRFLEIIDEQNLPGRNVAIAKLRARELRTSNP